MSSKRSVAELHDNARDGAKEPITGRRHLSLQSPCKMLIRDEANAGRRLKNGETACMSRSLFTETCFARKTRSIVPSNLQKYEIQNYTYKI